MTLLRILRRFVNLFRREPVRLPGGPTWNSAGARVIAIGMRELS